MPGGKRIGRNVVIQTDVNEEDFAGFGDLVPSGATVTASDDGHGTRGVTGSIPDTDLLSSFSGLPVTNLPVYELPPRG